MAEDDQNVPRAFVSYANEDRAVAKVAKNALEWLGLDAFLAHEHVRLSEEWRLRLLDELAACDVLVSIWSEKFRTSEWGNQEVGYVASRREVVNVPLSIDGTPPGGFLSHLQGYEIPPSGLTTGMILEPIARKFPRFVLPNQIRIATTAAAFRHAEETMAPLVPLFGEFTTDEAQALAEGAATNGQVWSAHLCRTKYLPEFIRICGDKVDPVTLAKLQRQITRDD